MKFRRLQLIIFRNLLQTRRFGVITNIRGRPKIKDLCNVFKSIIFKVKSGVNWEDTRCYGKYSASTVYKYFKQWCSNNLFDEIYRCSLRIYSKHKRIRWKYQSIDSTIIKAYRGGEEVGPNSTDRGRNGSKIHTIADKNGIPMHSISKQTSLFCSASRLGIYCYKSKLSRFKICSDSIEKIQIKTTAVSTAHEFRFCV